jgi:hypothetical protein
VLIHDRSSTSVSVRVHPCSVFIRVHPWLVFLRGFKLSVALALAISTPACVKHIAAPAPVTGDPHAAWARVLSRQVSAGGTIDFAAVARDKADLEAHVAWAARNGPRSTPARFSAREDQLAYYINAYNALAMYNVVVNTVRPKDKIRFFYLTTFAIDGRRMSLYNLENRVIRPLGEPRVHFALNCMVRGCPRLPQVPFTAADLDAELEAATRLFLNEGRNVRVDSARRTVWLSSILKWYEADFLLQAPSLLAYVNRYRDEPVPEDFAVRAIPYDWNLNQSRGCLG